MLADTDERVARNGESALDVVVVSVDALGRKPSLDRALAGISSPKLVKILKARYHY